MKNLINKLLIPFVIIYIRIIQYRYKRITTNNYFNRTNQHSNELILLQAKEYYYEQEFDSWGKYHPDFSYTRDQLKKHKKFMNWLFPKKDFKEWDITIWYNPRAITYYQNKIYKLNNGYGIHYEDEIPKQLNEWRNW